MIQPITHLSGAELRRLVGAGTSWLEQYAPYVNALNVFPVPDGDTGTNMLLTMQASMREADKVSSPHAGEVCAALSHGALLGARGNSGVILSQIIRGFARRVNQHETIDARLFAEALLEGSDAAYQGVVQPVEGTLLTVIREAAAAAIHAADESDDLSAVMAQTVAAARTAVLKTPELLPVLKDAGVVDAGGQGLLCILEGALKYLNGEPLQPVQLAGGAQHLEAFARPEGWGYDIQFHIRGQDLNVDEIRERIAAMGESALIVGDATLVKVHVHAQNPGDILKYAVQQGSLINILIENMQEQYLDFMAGHTADQRWGAENLGRAPVYLPSATTEDATGIATLAVVPGPGLRRIFESLGVTRVIEGGPTMNPSAQDLLQAIHSVRAEQVILLPNDKNIIPVALQAKALTAKKVQVIPSSTIPQGIAALLAFNYQADLATNLRIMSHALRRVRTVEVTIATRPVNWNGVRIEQGQPIALLDGELLALSNDLDVLVIEALRRANAAESEIITIYYGHQVTPEHAREICACIEREFPQQEIELHPGGQPLYPYIISIE